MVKYIFHLILIINRPMTKHQRFSISKTSLVLSSPNLGLGKIQEFIDMCRERYNKNKLNDKNNYVYTYNGIDSQTKKPLLEKKNLTHFHGSIPYFAKKQER